MSERSQQLKLVQMKCPSCGQNVTQFKPFNTTVECPYCHEKSINPLVVEREIDYPETMVECTQTEEDFSDYLLEQLIEGPYVPKDVFEKMDFGKLLKGYLPCYYFQGVYSCSWSCQVGYDESYSDRNGQTRTRTVWQPEHGTFTGDYNSFCLALNDKSLPKELTEFASHLEASNYDIVPFDPDILDKDSSEAESITAEKNITEEMAWRNCKALIEADAESELENVLPTPYRSERKNVSAKIDYCKYSFVPFWFVYYKYNGEQHFCGMDGAGVYGTVSVPKGKDIVGKINMIAICWVLIALIASGILYLCNKEAIPVEIVGIYVAGICFICWCAFKIQKFITLKLYRRARIKEAARVFPNSRVVQSKR